MRRRLKIENGEFLTDFIACVEIQESQSMCRSEPMYDLMIKIRFAKRTYAEGMALNVFALKTKEEAEGL